VSNSAWIVNSDVTVYHADRWFSWRDCEPIASRCALLLQRPITRAEWHLQHRHRHSQCNAVAVYAAAATEHRSATDPQLSAPIDNGDLVLW